MAEATLSLTPTIKLQSSSKRITLIDNFRGIAIIIYILTQTAAQYDNFLPQWFFHNAGINGMFNTNLGFMDLGPTLFYFIIGLTVVPAFRRRLEIKGTKAAYQDYLYRNMTLIALDSIVMFFVDKYLYPANWGIIRSIGLVGLFMMPFVKTTTNTRLFAAIIILLLYQILNQQIFYFFNGTEGGIAACFGFVTIVLFTSVLKDMLDKELLNYLYIFTLITSLCIISLYFLPISYQNYNSSYILSTLALYAMIFLFFALLDKIIKIKSLPPFTWMGQNLIVFFLLGASSQLYITKIFPSTNIIYLIYAELFVLFLSIIIAIVLHSNNLVIKISPK